MSRPRKANEILDKQQANTAKRNYSSKIRVSWHCSYVSIVKCCSATQAVPRGEVPGLP